MEKQKLYRVTRVIHLSHIVTAVSAEVARGKADELGEAYATIDYRSEWRARIKKPSAHPSIE